MWHFVEPFTSRMSSTILMALTACVGFLGKSKLAKKSACEKNIIEIDYRSLRSNNPAFSTNDF